MVKMVPSKPLVVEEFKQYASLGRFAVSFGRFGRGYARSQFVYDLSDGTPRIIYRADRTGLGWALGREVRESLELFSNRS